MNRTLWIAAAATLLASAAHAQPRVAADDTMPPAPGMPNFATVIVEGVPDSVRPAFMGGFRGAFTEASFRTERPGVREGTMLPGVPLSNRFRMLEGTPARGTWQAQVSLEWLVSGKAAPKASAAAGATEGRGGGGGRSLEARPVPKGRSGTDAKAPPAPNLPGVRVTYFALTPEAVAAGARVIPDREILRFHFGATAGARYWSQAGRSVALLLLESLHHQSEDLDADMKLTLEGCDRGGP